MIFVVTDPGLFVNIQSQAMRYWHNYRICLTFLKSSIMCSLQGNGGAVVATNKLCTLTSLLYWCSVLYGVSCMFWRIRSLGRACLSAYRSYRQSTIETADQKKQSARGIFSGKVFQRKTADVFITSFAESLPTVITASFAFVSNVLTDHISRDT